MKTIVGQSLRLTDRFKHGKPQKDLGDDRQEPHERSEREISTVDQSFLQRDAQDDPPTGQSIAAFVSVEHEERNSSVLRCTSAH